MAKKAMNIKIDPEQIMHSGISVSKDGYKSARMLVKVGEKEYMNVGYEWEGEGVPSFVMDMMSFMKSNAEAVEKAKEEHAADYKEYIDRDTDEKEDEEAAPKCPSGQRY